MLELQEILAIDSTSAKSVCFYRRFINPKQLNVNLIEKINLDHTNSQFNETLF